jgi:hypothetical protein
MFHFLQRPREFGLNRSGAPDENFSSVGQCHAKFVALEECEAKFVFQFLDTSGYRRLGKPEMLRARTKAAPFDDRDHIPQMMQFHADTPGGKIGRLSLYLIGNNLRQMASYCNAGSRIEFTGYNKANAALIG